MTILPINQNSYLDNILQDKTTFKETIIDDYYDKIDDVWDYASDIQTILLQENIGSTVYNSLEVRAIRTFKPKTQDSRGDDWVEFLFKDKNLNPPFGIYIKWKDNWWLGYNKDNYTYPTHSIICRRCATTFNWLDKWGVEHTYPVVVGKPKEASDYVNVQFNSPSGFLPFWLQLDENSRYIQENDRFMIGNKYHWSSYKVFGAGVLNYNNEYTMVDESAGLLQLICGIYYENDDSDNLDLGIANYYSKLFNMQLDQTSISQTIGNIIKIIPTIKKGNEIQENVEVFWETEDADIATVDENGNITLVSVGVTNITCTMLMNTSVQQKVLVNVVPSIDTNNYNIILYPNNFNIKQGKTNTYQVQFYKNDILSTPTNLKITLNSNYVPLSNYIFTIDNNQFSIKNKEKYFNNPLIVNIYTDEISISQEFWLMGAL